MAELKALDLTQLRTELVRQNAPWRSVDTTIAMLEEQDRRRLLDLRNVGGSSYVTPVKNSSTVAPASPSARALPRR